MTTSRIPFLDALRGPAAFGVVAHHYGAPLGWLNYGNLGVPMFFVLSGFAIRKAVGALPPESFGYLGRFAARRAIRLDPPYWVSMLAVILIGLIAQALVGYEPKPTSVSQILTHLVYLQGFAGHEQIQVIYWTLCYEIQFYLVLIPILWVGNRFSSAVPLLFATMLLSLADRHFEITGAAFMGRFWFCFAAGVFACAATEGTMKASHFGLGLAIIGAFGALTGDPYAITTVITAAALYAVVTYAREDFGSHPVLQFFGRISYSLYLTHLIGGWLVLIVAMKFMPGWAAMCVALGASILSAWIFHLVVEAPAVKLSKLVKMPASRTSSS
jgi:peptidoglycan/LPS O-acetylase OafA/YrhL